MNATLRHIAEKCVTTEYQSVLVTTSPWCDYQAGSGISNKRGPILLKFLNLISNNRAKLNCTCAVNESNLRKVYSGVFTKLIVHQIEQSFINLLLILIYRSLFQAQVGRTKHGYNYSFHIASVLEY